MKLITAISKNRIERQQECIYSWSKVADEIVAVNTKQDIDYLRPLFPSVNFIECPTHLTGERLYNRPDRVSIYALCQQGPGLLINSDIYINNITKDNFNSIWSYHYNMFKVGIRTNISSTYKRQEPYGIDCFLITEDIMHKIPELGFIIGTSVWDFWIIWHMATLGYEIKPIYGHLHHLEHESSWNETDTQIGLGILAKKYKLTQLQITTITQSLTQRGGK